MQAKSAQSGQHEKTERMIVVRTGEGLEGPYSEQEIFHLWSQDVVDMRTPACLQLHYVGTATCWQPLADVIPRLAGSLKDYTTIYVERQYILRNTAKEAGESSASEGIRQEDRRETSSQSSRADPASVPPQTPNKGRERASEPPGRGGPQSQPSREQESRPRSVAFNCAKCETKIRIQLRPERVTYRCPQCRTEYRTIHVDGELPVFLVIPHFPEPTPPPREVPKRKRAFTAEVRTALATLELGEQAEFDDVREAYRERVKLYHPDKVSHLGVDLKKVAEAKTKEFNAAYRVLERFYSE